MTRQERDEQEQVLGRLRRDARVLADDFGLPLRSVDAERPQVKRRYGICYEDGSIRIRLRHVRTRKLLRYSALVDTLCHELAHLRHFDHGVRFQAFYRRILEHARRSGIYRPRPRRPALAVQAARTWRLQPTTRDDAVLPVSVARRRRRRQGTYEPRFEQLELFPVREL